MSCSLFIKHHLYIFTCLAAVTKMSLLIWWWSVRVVFSAGNHIVILHIVTSPWNVVSVTDICSAMLRTRMHGLCLLCTWMDTLIEMLIDCSWVKRRHTAPWWLLVSMMRAITPCHQRCTTVDISLISWITV